MIRPLFVTRNAPDDLWETLRQIRNECLSGLTGSPYYVTPEKQLRYRFTYDVERVRHYLFFAEGEAVGYGRIEYVDGPPAVTLPSLGVARKHRRKGYGREIARLILLMCGEHMVGTMYDDNETIKKIDFSLGWRPTGPAVRGVLPVECPWPPPFVPSEEHPQRAYDEIMRYHDEASSSDGSAQGDR